ncbi:hypothetical protein AL755_10900 [Arthrobacter sp. ERGS1:01]|uniref:hypothetical protein n=1 Tax=Arthrobacter sp. ERGS1:01 TaxID=1704044 RepID=UPI0006B43FFA|nr:hypothetical protein [Arthrobacter sp. ERGS1:01]ALE05860.1 hypothetical protein AL755_10900 [Arthrobacter sp. ERGS1:01]
MGNKRLSWSSWLLTRCIYVAGTMATLFSIGRLVAGGGSGFWLGIAAGLLLLALATRGPWDAADSGRNRSVFGFRARPEPADPQRQ